MYKELTDKIKTAVKEAEGIRNDYISRGDYTLVGQQESCINGLEIALDGFNQDY
jgi:hypothetical protein